MIVVAHGGILTGGARQPRAAGRIPLLAAAAERPFTASSRPCANCSVTQLEWPGPRLLAFNETGTWRSRNRGILPAIFVDDFGRLRGRHRSGQRCGCGMGFFGSACSTSKGCGLVSQAFRPCG